MTRLLNEVADNHDQLPILQHALMRTWDYWQTYGRTGDPMSLEDYEAIGTMADAISLHGDAVFNGLRNDNRSRRLAAQAVDVSLTKLQTRIPNGHISKSRAIISSASR